MAFKKAIRRNKQKKKMLKRRGISKGMDGLVTLNDLGKQRI
jgi:hypothetical protein|tara:strand:- start:1635 stop:1757 length:123 start_codon:yes stop_codon:yes gene_type:complete